MTESEFILKVKQEVCQMYGITIEEIEGKRKYEPIGTARRLAVYFIYFKCTKISQTHIASSFKRVPSSINTMIQRLDKRLNKKPKIMANYKKLQEIFTESIQIYNTNFIPGSHEKIVYNLLKEGLLLTRTVARIVYGIPRLDLVLRRLRIRGFEIKIHKINNKCWYYL